MKNFFREKDPVSWIPGIIRHDFLRKMIAFFFALLLYFAIASRIGSEEKISSVPVKISVPANLVNLDADRQYMVTVTVRGSKKALSEVNASTLKIKTAVPPTTNTDVPYMIRLSPKIVEAPFGVTVIDVDPRDIVLKLEPVISMLLPIEARFNSVENLEKAYDVGNIIFQPEKVWVRGPKTIIDALKAVPTQPSPLERQVVDSFEYQAKLAPPARVTVTPPEVTASVEIVKPFTTRSFRDIPVRILYPAHLPPEQYHVEFLGSPVVTATLSGPRGSLMEIKHEDVKAFVDLAALNEPGSYTINASVFFNAPPGITLKEVYPQKVQLKLTHR